MSRKVTRRTFTKTATAATLSVAATHAGRALGANDLLHYEYRKPWELR